ncbi:hypothetical protein OK349_19005 [Sphingomonas sp. BT-65]|uniref:hypothetical protein n=1 Tax=Sphingomonas sp. BT-65 TaxID=2989821 RepID=UPI00223589C4|nr:hypothetical protein [Sphingomonas sp. BT-65]MCW4463799.1 hypothetical protein [Sphingomonas sp. BT-65]
MIDRPPVSSVAEPVLPSRVERKAGEHLGSFEALMARVIAVPRLPVLPDEPPLGVSAHPLPAQAQVFNEDGFFAETRTMQTAGPGPHRNMQTACPVDGMRPVDPVASDPRAEGVLPIASGYRGVSRTLARLDGPGTAPLSVARGAAPRPSSEHRVAPSIEHPVEPPALADVENFSAELPDRRSRIARAQSLLSVALRDIERGLQVRVTAQALSRDERERLANKIAALLSRHGLTPHEVLIAAPIANRNSGKK